MSKTNSLYTEKTITPDSFLKCFSNTFIEKILGQKTVKSV